MVGFEGHVLRDHDAEDIELIRRWGVVVDQFENLGFCSVEMERIGAGVRPDVLHHHSHGPVDLLPVLGNDDVGGVVSVEQK